MNGFQKLNMISSMSKGGSGKDILKSAADATPTFAKGDNKSSNGGYGSSACYNIDTSFMEDTDSNKYDKIWDGDVEFLEKVLNDKDSSMASVAAEQVIFMFLSGQYDVSDELLVLALERSNSYFCQFELGTLKLMKRWDPTYPSPFTKQTYGDFFSNRKMQKYLKQLEEMSVEEKLQIVNRFDLEDVEVTILCYDKSDEVREALLESSFYPVMQLLTFDNNKDIAKKAAKKLIKEKGKKYGWLYKYAKKLAD